jgi:hypothetical protein
VGVSEDSLDFTLFCCHFSVSLGKDKRELDGMLSFLIAGAVGEQSTEKIIV